MDYCACSTDKKCETFCAKKHNKMEPFTRFRWELAMLVVFICPSIPCGAKPISQNILESEVVAVMRIISLAPAVRNPTTVDAQSRLRGGRTFSGGNQGQLRICEIDVLQALKGTPPARLQFMLPPIDRIQYYGDSSLTISEQRPYLVFLKQTKEGTWVPNDPTAPIIPVADNMLNKPTTLSSALTVQEASKPSVSDAVVHILLASLSDSRSRVSAMYFLRTTRNDSVVSAARMALSDPNLDMQQNALCCLAENQAVDVIPRIADLSRKISQAGHGTGHVLEALRYYDTVMATPYLNMLLSDADSTFVRLNAVMALQQNDLADQSSIPYLLPALRDTEVSVAFQADGCLHKLIPALGPRWERNSFMQHRDEDIQKAEAWWADEQAGKHGNTPLLVRPHSAVPPPAAQPSNPRSSRGPAD